MANPGTQPEAARIGTHRDFRYNELRPNPLNPRRLFDKLPLQVLEASIRKNGILVPLTVYQERRNSQFYILDGERRWRCASTIATDPQHAIDIIIPANVVDPPSKAANILWMFNIHNLREQWELMPAALSLKVVMEELQEKDEHRLAELTHMSEPNIRRCKLLLSFDDKYQQLMLAQDPEQRIPANFFVELAPVLDLYERLPKRRRASKTRNGLTDHFLEMYRSGAIPSVIHFRRVLEAYDISKESDEGTERVEYAMQRLAEDSSQKIRKLFDPLVAEDKSVISAEELCRDFVARLKKLSVGHATRRRAMLQKRLRAVRIYVDSLLIELEGDA